MLRRQDNMGVNHKLLCINIHVTLLIVSFNDFVYYKHCRNYSNFNKMKFIIILALVCTVAADVSLLRSPYLPPRESAEPRDVGAAPEAEGSAFFPDEPQLEEDVPKEPSFDAPAGEGNTQSSVFPDSPLNLVPNAVDEPEPAHSYDEETGYSYKSPF